MGAIHYINPGNPIFDSLVKVILRECKEDMLKGAVLISPYDIHPHYAYYVKSQITDSQTYKETESIADEKLLIAHSEDNQIFQTTSPARATAIATKHMSSSESIRYR